MKTPLRIAILECDTPPPAVVEKYGKYGAIFTTLLETAAAGVSLDSKQDLALSSFDVVSAQEYPALEDIDAVLISGSSTTTPSTPSFLSHEQHYAPQTPRLRNYTHDSLGAIHSLQAEITSEEIDPE